jgi:hypothetical protein
MKSFNLAILALACCALAACGGESGSSTSIDSTNNLGTAPAQYTEGTPENRIDTSMQGHDARMKDTIRSGGAGTLPQNQPVGNGTNSSNTTDKTTTSGSANHGDADKDRKK